MSQITLLQAHPFIVEVCAAGAFAMLFLAAIARVIVPREAQFSEVQSRLGHVGLTVIALVYVLVSMWQR